MTGPNNGRVSLGNNIIRDQFINAMNTLRENQFNMREYDSKLFDDLESAYQLAGASLTISVKQLNHIRQVAWDFEKGC